MCCVTVRRFHRIKRRAEARRREREEEEGGGAGEADLLERAERLRATVSTYLCIYTS